MNSSSSSVYGIVDINSTDYCVTIVIDYEFAILDSDGTFGMWIVRSLFGRPRDVTIDVVNVESLSLGLQDPHWNCLIFQVLLIEVEDDVLTGHLDH